MGCPIHTWLMVDSWVLVVHVFRYSVFVGLKSEPGLRVGSAVHDHYRFDPGCRWPDLFEGRCWICYLAWSNWIKWGIQSPVSCHWQIALANSVVCLRCLNTPGWVPEGMWAVFESLLQALTKALVIAWNEWVLVLWMRLPLCKFLYAWMLEGPDLQMNGRRWNDQQVPRAWLKEKKEQI